MGNPIDCIKAIHNVNESVEGNDPRGWMKACAEETLLKMGNLRNNILRIPKDMQICYMIKLKESVLNRL
jgi:hypothetical protein